MEFSTAVVEVELIYLRPRDATKLTVPDLPRRARDLFELVPRGFDLAVAASVSHETLTEIARLLSEGGS
jgi:hypothetical protein